MIIAKVRFNKKPNNDGFMLLTVPRDSGLNVGDHVQLVKVPDYTETNKKVR